MTLAEYKRRAEVNATQIASWRWMARHAIRKGQPVRALEAIAAALWLMGADEGRKA